MQHIQTPPPPLRSDVPPAVEAVVLRALAKDPTARFERAEQFVAALARAYLTSTPNAAATAIHQQATVIWQSGGAPVSLASSLPSDAAHATPAAGASGKAKEERRLSLLPLLGGAFALLLIAGMILAMRSSASTARQSSAAAPTMLAATATPAVENLATPAPESVIPPPDTPVAPTAVSPPTPVPPATPEAPSAPPAASGNALADLRALLTSATTDGRGGRDVQKWLETLDAFEHEIGRGDARKARDKLRELQRALTQAERTGKLPADLTKPALQHVQAIADAYRIDLGR